MDVPQSERSSREVKVEENAAQKQNLHAAVGCWSEPGVEQHQQNRRKAHHDA
jgi:hypothetical protein